MWGLLCSTELGMTRAVRRKMKTTIKTPVEGKLQKQPPQGSVAKNAAGQYPCRFPRKVSKYDVFFMHILTRGTVRSGRGDEFRASAGPYPLYVCGGKKKTLRKLNTHPYWRGMRKPPPILRWRSFANPYHLYAGGPSKSTAEARFPVPRKMPCTT